MSKYENNERIKLIQTLKPIMQSDIPPISFTSDMWTYKFLSRSWLAISIHYLNDILEMCEQTLGCHEFDALLNDSNNDNDTNDNTDSIIDNDPQFNLDLISHPHTSENISKGLIQILMISQCGHT